MAKIADVVCAIPYKLNGQWHTRWVRVGALLQSENNDASKGPGYMIALDRHFNPAGVPPGPNGDGASILLSTYWPEDKGGNKVRPSPGYKQPPQPREPRKPIVRNTARPASSFDDMDDDNPF
jgi:hypothetical protein